ncbi:MAG: killer suppression protein HigA [Candidatus Zixiibacteriota bacterium]
MDVVIRSSALRSACNDSRKGLRKFGEKRFMILRRRLDDLAASNTMAEIPFTAGCHPLRGSRAGQYAINLDGAWRLVFRPANDPLPKHEAGGIDLKRVTMIEVLEVTDYHG